MSLSIKNTFEHLINTLADVDKKLAIHATKAINISLTIRNWLMGYYIASYELHGLDRAKYGKNLFLELSKRLEKINFSNCRPRQLYYYTSFYRTYPQILRTVTAKFRELLPNTLNVSKPPL